MAEEESKQPRKVKDLKARLGRTIAPNTPGAPVIAPPGGGIAPPPGMPGMVGAPPAAQTPAPASGDGVVPPPGLPVPPMGGTAPGAPLPALNLGAKPVVVPLFVQQQQEEDDRKRAAKKEKEAASRAVIMLEGGDVEAHETGRAGRNKAIAAIAGGVLFLGLVLGYVTGGTMAERRDHNAAVTAGQEINTALDASDAKIEEIRRHLQTAITAATGAPGRAAKVDYDALRALLAVANPFTATTFSSKRYDKFPTDAVSGIFAYYTSVTALFDTIHRFTSRNLTATRRAELDEGARAVGDLTGGQTGCVPTIVQQRVLCDLVFVDPPGPGATAATPLKVRASSSVRTTADRLVFTGQNLIEEPNKYVILTNTQTSLGVLGQRAGAFAEYRQGLVEILASLEDLGRKKGRLQQSLAPVLQLHEVFTF